jgi:hypothetical protein
MSQRSTRLPAVLGLPAYLHMIYFTKYSVAQVLYGTDAIIQSCVITKILGSKVKFKKISIPAKFF